MSKILTVSIAAYNMENYIDQCIGSLLDERIIEDLEILVDDDGGSDRTLAIAQQYAQRYPDSVFPVHKENGGWGSVLNDSLARANGRYFKLLDGDDWFDTDGLFALVQTLKSTDADLVITTNKFFQDNKLLYTGSVPGSLPQKILPIDALNKDTPLFGMWGMTIKTDVARRIGFDLPQHKFYTDLIFVQGVLSKTRTVLYLDAPVYCYRHSRPGQSTSMDSRAKHYQEQIYVCKRCAEIYQEQKAQHCGGLSYMKKRAAATQCLAYKSIIYLYTPKRVIAEIKRFDAELHEISEDVYKAVVRFDSRLAKPLRVLRMTGFYPLLIMKIVPRDWLARLSHN